MRRCRRRQQEGYALLIVMLIFSIFVISLAMAVPRWKTEIQRDRENMAIDRAHQYVEGIKRYYHKFGSYPPNLKRLEETNGIHYLRQPWPDPLTPDGKWKLLQFSDLKNGEIVGGGGMGLPGGVNQGPNGATTGTNHTSGSIFGGGGIGMSGGIGMYSGMSGGIGGSIGGGMGGSNPGGGLFSDADTSDSDSSSTGATAASGTEAAGSSTATSTSSSSSQSSGSGPSAGQSGGLFGGPSNPGTRQVFGGTGIVGVASTSKKPAIHAFNRKNRPDKWQFVYNPMQDKSLLGPGVGNGPALGQQIGTQPGATSGDSQGGGILGSGPTGTTSSGPGSNPGGGLFGDSGSN